MITAMVTNVNSALSWGVEQFTQAERDPANVIAPRGNKTVELPVPVTTVYYRPTERVLFNPVRDANPFFHFFEALWMLAGRNDLAFPLKFNKQFAEYSDDGESVWGAYGWRWRGFFGVDQIKDIITLLKLDPNSRRAVVGMWSAGEDLEKGMNGGKDVPCNTSIYFKIRKGRLNMTVNNRSNDMLWGAYGANAVHMSMLQEYVAGKLGIPVGLYYQVSDSLHVYLEGKGGELWERLKNQHADERGTDPYVRDVSLRPFPMDANEFFDNDLQKFFEYVDADADKIYADKFQHPFFARVAVPLWWAWHSRELKDLDHCLAHDWRKAAAQWITRRKQNG